MFYLLYVQGPTIFACRAIFSCSAYTVRQTITDQRKIRNISFPLHFGIPYVQFWNRYVECVKMKMVPLVIDC